MMAIHPVYAAINASLSDGEKDHWEMKQVAGIGLENRTASVRAQADFNFSADIGQTSAVTGLDARATRTACFLLLG